MKDGKIPNPMTIHPIAGYDKEIYVKPTLKNPNIVDDHFMKISHVMRAQEWIPSTPLHIQMYRAFDYKKLEYFNANYIRQFSTEELYKWTLPFITGTGDALLEINPENPQPKPNVGPEFSGVALGWNYRFCII